MPFQVGQICYPDNLSARDALQTQYPTSPDVNGDIWYIRDLSVDVNGFVLGNLYKSSSWTSTPIVNLSLQPCTIQTSAYVFDKYPVQDILFFAALVIVSLIGFATGRSK